MSVPTDAIPSASLMTSLKKLIADDRNLIFIVSGRDAPFLDQHFGQHLPSIGLSGEHGCLLKLPLSLITPEKRETEENPSASVWRDMTKEGGFDLSWKQEVMAIFAYYTERTVGSFIEEKQASVTWHYRLSDPSYG